MTHAIASALVATSTAVTPNNARSFAGVSRKSVTEFEVPVSMILEEEGFNARMDSVENAKHIEGIAKSIARTYRETGVVEHETIKVTPVKLEDDTEAFVLFDGHCTFNGLMKAKSEYEVPVETVRVLAKQMSEEQRMLAVLDTNQQKKLNLIERGKQYMDLIEGADWNQAGLAERYHCSQAEISQCISAFKMPEEMKNLVAQGILSDRDALTKYTREVRVKGDEEATQENLTNFTAKIVEASQIQKSEGGEVRVRVNSKKTSAKTTKAPKMDEDRADNLRQSLQVLETKFSDLTGDECAAVPFSATEIAILKTFLANNTVA